MSPHSHKIAVTLLRWTLGLVVLWESFVFAFSHSAARHFAAAGFPHWLRPAIAGIEIIAALLLLVPWTELFGGYLLLFVFAAAAIIHLLHGDFDITALILYAVCVTVCMTQRNTQIGGSAAS
jgi:DoxX-like family